MTTLAEELRRALPDVLPTKPEEALTGTALIERLGEKLSASYSPASIRSHLSILAQDPTSPIARFEHGYGYYLRPAATIQEARNDVVVEIPPAESGSTGRVLQLEEKFRSIYTRYAELNNQFPMMVEHTSAARRSAGVNKWKFPDLIVLEWEVGEVTDSGFHLDRHLLEVKRSLGEQPFKLSSIELKVEVSLSSFREYFFQCVSNSKWAHNAVLAIAGKISDKSLAEELRRLGSSYDVSIVAFGLDAEVLGNLPSADSILQMDDAAFEEIAEKVSVSRIATARGREVLDWEHLHDMRKQSAEFTGVMEWISYCLEKKAPYRYTDFLKLREIEDKMRR